jgi:hypothetical protein
VIKITGRDLPFAVYLNHFPEFHSQKSVAAVQSVQSDLFWEIFAFGVAHIGMLVWTLSSLKSTVNAHTARLEDLEPDVENLRDRISRVEGYIEMKKAGESWLQLQRP